MDKALKIFSLLYRKYPKAKTALKYNNSWQMLVSTILSAQCTDKRVNEITEKLFSKYPDVKDYINMKQDTLIKHIRSAGFYRNKSKNILLAAETINKNFSGNVPDTMDQMLTIPGVARKTANVVLGNVYGVIEGIAVDTHVKRLASRLGLTNHKDPNKIEKDLMDILPKNKWHDITYLLIEHGRTVCKAQTPACSKCIVNSLCPKKEVTKYL